MDCRSSQASLQFPGFHFSKCILLLTADVIIKDFFSTYAMGIFGIYQYIEKSLQAMEVPWSKTLFQHKTLGKWQWGDSEGSSLAMSLLDDITNNIGLFASIIAS